MSPLEEQLRDTFAAHALTGLLQSIGIPRNMDQAKAVADKAYRLASLMLEARGNQPRQPGEDG